VWYASGSAIMADLFLPLGDRAIRFPRPEGSTPRALVRAIHTWPGVVDVVVSRDDVAVYFAEPPVVEPARLAALPNLPLCPDPPRELVLRAIYDGPDLDEVAQAAGLSTAEVIEIHGSATYVVETMGFAPGFGYLAGTDPRLAPPRRNTPRTRVPAGSLALAAGYTAVYPFDSPGGWHLIGRVAERMFSASGPFLQLGDRVRFER
jgi:allophanate hydrolase subunit 1